VIDITKWRAVLELIFSWRAEYIPHMRVLCVGRHPYLSEHLCRFFENLGVDCVGCVGLEEATLLVAEHDPDAVICEYDLLATMSLAAWEEDPVLGQIPVIAVSLTRHPGEAHLLDVNGIAGFLYLPTLEPEDAQRVLGAVRRKRAGINPPTIPWPVPTPLAQSR
jgi:DNA-binding NarL/FixJ family response regulator